MTTKSEKEPKTLEFQFYPKPKKESQWKTFQKSIYDSEKHEIFGKTKERWYKLFIFFGIYYVCLSILFAICMKGLQSTINDKEPKYKLDESLIGSNPGLGFRPISKQTEEGSLIWYDLKKTTTTEKWINLLDEFLAPYQIEQVGKNYQECDYNKPLQEGHVCTVNMEQFGQCTKKNNYGYNSDSPCVFLKLNRIFDWVPEYYTSIESNMPADVVSLIQTANETKKEEIWISCRGENSFDKERVDSFRYYPTQGFPGYYFPYTNNPNYLSPIIAVQVVGVKPNSIVNIECRAWAKNIKYSGRQSEREGSVHFEIMVDGL